MKPLQRLSIYVLATIVIEGSSIALLYSFGYPGSISGTSAFLVLLVAFNFMLLFLWGNAMGGPGAAAPQGSLIYNPLLQVTVGILGMFIIIAVIGEGINWLYEGVEKSTKS